MLDKKDSLAKTIKKIGDTRVQDKKRMTANHTYNSKTQRGRFTQISKTMFGKNLSAFIQKKTGEYTLSKKGSIFNMAKDHRRNSSQLEFSDINRISSFKASTVSIKGPKETSSRAYQTTPATKTTS